MTKEEIPVLTVSQITGFIKETLEAGFRRLTIEGEISNYRPASSGHIYFALKDEEAMIACVLFRNAARGLGFRPRDGQKVRVSGDLSVYARRGNYQIIVTAMSLAGEGDILLMLEERKRALAAEGLFDNERKQPLPLLPTRVAVITSPTGAAVRDILNVLGRRHAGISVTILPSAVQGDGAAEQIARQIRTANLHSLGDVIIIGRGGGALEDLLAFSEETVVRAIAASEIPVISAVGHEVDWALSDFAADYRAPTPSAAAEVVSASRDELSARSAAALRQLLSGVRNRTSRIRLILERFSPAYMERMLRQKLQPLLLRLDDGKEALIEAMASFATARRHRIALSTEKLRSGSPQLIMQKGYGLIKHKGKILNDSRETAVGDELVLRLARGRIDAGIIRIEHEEEIK